MLTSKLNLLLSQAFFVINHSELTRIFIYSSLPSTFVLFNKEYIVCYSLQFCILAIINWTFIASCVHIVNICWWKLKILVMYNQRHLVMGGIVLSSSHKVHQITVNYRHVWCLNCMLKNQANWCELVSFHKDRTYERKISIYFHLIFTKIYTYNCMEI